MAIAEAWKQSLYKPPALRLSQWAEQYFYLSAESSYTEGKWQRVAWQTAIMDCISNDDIRIVDFIKSARVGATKMMLAGVGYFAHHKKRNQVFFQPTDNDMEDFSLTEITPMLRDVKVMTEVFPWGQTSNKYNRTNKKTFIGSILDIRGGKSAGNYRRMTKDVAWYDELEAFDRDIDGEGSPLTLGDKRISNSLFPKSVRATTPKDEAGSLIQEEVDNADFYMRYHVPCPHCKKKQVLKWGGKDCHYGFKFQWPEAFKDAIQPKEAAAKSVRYECEHCHEHINNSQIDWMNDNGVWIDPNNGVWIDENGGFRDSDGNVIEPPRHIAFHIWAAYSPWFPWSEMLLEFFEAVIQKRVKGTVEKLKTFVNTSLGETWKDTTKPLSSDPLFNRREPFPQQNGKMLVPRKALAIFAGFDMQDDRVEGEIRAYDEFERSWLLGYYRIFGDPKQPAMWDELERVFKQSFITEDGRQLVVMRGCFDSGGHYTKEVYAFCRRIGIFRLIPTKGWNSYDKPTTFPRKANQHGVYLTMVDTESAKNTLEYRHNLVLEPGSEAPAGYCHYPIADFTDEEYFKQLTAEEKELTRHNKKLRYVWVAKGRRNEPWDCAVGSLTALEISVQHMGLSLETLALQRDADIQNKPVSNVDRWAELGKRNK